MTHGHKFHTFCTVIVDSCMYVYVLFTRKEKRVFETYKVEALAARNKKEKEDIEILRREVRFQLASELVTIRSIKENNLYIILQCICM